MELSKYRYMWVFAMFDLPTETAQDKRNYTQFRKVLLKDGFTQMQYSVYTRHCPTQENVDVHVRRIETNLPPDGEVRVLVITEKQFEKMRIFWGKRRKAVPDPPSQLEFF